MFEHEGSAMDHLWAVLMGPYLPSLPKGFTGWTYVTEEGLQRPSNPMVGAMIAAGEAGITFTEACKRAKNEDFKDEVARRGDAIRQANNGNTVFDVAWLDSIAAAIDMDATTLGRLKEVFARQANQKHDVHWPTVKELIPSYMPVEIASPTLVDPVDRAEEDATASPDPAGGGPETGSKALARREDPSLPKRGLAAATTSSPRPATPAADLPPPPGDSIGSHRPKVSPALAGAAAVTATLVVAAVLSAVVAAFISGGQTAERQESSVTVPSSERESIPTQPATTGTVGTSTSTSTSTSTTVTSTTLPPSPSTTPSTVQSRVIPIGSMKKIESLADFNPTCDTRVGGVLYADTLCFQIHDNPNGAFVVWSIPAGYSYLSGIAGVTECSPSNHYTVRIRDAGGALLGDPIPISATNTKPFEMNVSQTPTFKLEISRDAEEARRTEYCPAIAEFRLAATPQRNQ